MLCLYSPRFVLAACVPHHAHVGKYTPEGPRPAGPRGSIYAQKIKEIQPLISVLRAVGEERGKTPAQVSNDSRPASYQPLPISVTAKAPRHEGCVQTGRRVKAVSGGGVVCLGDCWG